MGGGGPVPHQQRKALLDLPEGRLGLGPGGGGSMTTIFVIAHCFTVPAKACDIINGSCAYERSNLVGGRNRPEGQTTDRVHTTLHTSEQMYVDLP